MDALNEQLGSFYLGGSSSTEDGERTPVYYDARDLTTHAVCVGMTGSGKTGLCVGLLEEAALDKVPALIIDPKGDITNLLLQFPELRPEDFQPWVNVDDARRKGQSVKEYAAGMADLWRNGLGEWGIDGRRIQLLRESADFTIYTPGSDAGAPINIMGSMAAPKVDFDSDAEMLRERISGTVAALLGLVEVDEDPVRSREGILLATIFEEYWRKGEDLDLAQLILSIQTPPMEKLGVFDLETFFPSGDRLKLAMAFNNLVASPAFSEWLRGEPLDIDTLLYLDDGTPRHSIFYLAHLTESERMFFVTLLLENLITWMRRQSGTTSLRALLYFDEVFGFFPPTAEPPSKRPLLTIMKQARAFGLGALLVTQNPVDIDYKGLANAGTWFIGKMQTERDRSRVLSGLEGAIAESDGVTGASDYDAVIAGLQGREFLLHNVHADAPMVFNTRWVMSYLRGPLTRVQVRSLMDEAGKRGGSGEAGMSDVAASASQTPEPKESDVVTPVSAGEALPGYSATRPTLDAGLPQLFMPVTIDADAASQSVAEVNGRTQPPDRITLVYLPGALGVGTVHFVDRKHAISAERNVALWQPLSHGVDAIDWERALSLPAHDRGRLSDASVIDSDEGPFFAPVPDVLDSSRDAKAATKALEDWLYYGARFQLGYQQALDLAQRPDEDERDFLIRLRQAAREARDSEVDSLEDKYEARIETAQEKIDDASRRLDELESELSSRRQQEMIGLGENALRFFMNRRSSRVFSGVGSRRERTMKANQALDNARARLEDMQTDASDLAAELEVARSEVTLKWASALDQVETKELKPRREDVDVEPVALAWAPYWLIESDGDSGRVGRLIEAFETKKSNTV